MFHELTEANLSQIARKQKSITRLFPDFYSNPIKVRGVVDKGGVRMTGMTADRWEFKIHSGSESDKWYEAVVRWKNLDTTVKQLVKNKTLWNKDKTHVDLKKLAAEVFKKADIELSDNCPAQLYYGGDYILTQRDAKYGDPENRPPVIRNPKEYGIHCKHLQVLMRVLPFYKGTMANWLKREHSDWITQAEAEANQTSKQVKQAGKALAQKNVKGIRKGKWREV